MSAKLFFSPIKAAVCLAFFACTLVIGANELAHAQSLVSQETVDQALELANRIESKNLVLTTPESIEAISESELSGPKKLKKLRHLAMDSVFLRINTPITDILPIYEKVARNQRSERDIAIVEIIRLQNEIQSHEPSNSALAELQAFREHPDWFVAQRAALLESNLATFDGSYDVGLRDTRAALSLIPNQLTPDVLEAQYETYDLIAFFQLILNNIEAGITSTEQVIEKGLAHDRPIDGIGYINNLNYVFNSWYEYETAEKLAKALFRLSQKTDGGRDIYAHLRLAQAQNNAEHYRDALETINNISEPPKLPNLKLRVILARAVAYAGLGQTEEAKQSLAEYEQIKQDESVGTAEHENVKLHVLALIAAQKNDANTTFEILNSRLKSVVQLQLSRQSKGIQSLQANLENDKNRQSEREAALIRESKLRQSELEAKQRSNVALMGLAGMLFLTALAATGFAIWRQKISKILEIAAHEAEAGDRAKSQFLSVMSHELRTPLNGIIGIAGILSERGETEELRNYNKLILKSGQNLLQLLSGILDMAQMESGKLNIVTAPANIRQIVNNICETVKTEIDTAKIQFTCYVADDIPDDLMLDGIRIKQALSNLLANAVRFTEKGRIHVHVTLGKAGVQGVRNLTMIVADTGRGIDEDVQTKLFKPFVQADSSLTRTHDGAGIGLAVTRGLSRLMGGDVTMTSKAGRGSEFTMTVKTCAESDARIDPETQRRVFEVEASAEPKIDFAPAVSLEKLRADEAEKERQARLAEETKEELISAEFEEDEDLEFETLGIEQYDISAEIPVIQAETESITPLPEGPERDFTREQARLNAGEHDSDQLRGLNILIVEDVQANQEVLASLLEPVGCRVSCAENGRKALDMMGTQVFDAVLMDIRMPILDGIGATKAIRSMKGPHQNVAIIALTADASAENNAECLAAGADVFLTKPVVVSELFSSIRFARRKQYRQKQKAALSA